MKFAVRHRLEFRYSKPVFIEPMILRLRPLENPWQSLDSYEIKFDPEPSGRTDCLDLHSNSATWIWFKELTDHVIVKTRLTARTHYSNPFDFISFWPERGEPPFSYEPHQASALVPFLHREDPSESAYELAKRIWADSGGDPTDFCVRLADWMYGNLKSVMRKHGHPFAPEKTLKDRTGTCRDFAVAYIDACRSLGLAARFVSGYAEDNMNLPDQNLHAWAEVYLPGGGWRGFDPSLGLAVSDRHLALATSPWPASAAPTMGTYRGTDATSELDFMIDLELTESNPKR